METIWQGVLMSGKDIVLTKEEITPAYSGKKEEYYSSMTEKIDFGMKVMASCREEAIEKLRLTPLSERLEKHNGGTNWEGITAENISEDE